MFSLLSVSCLVGELFLITHDRYANSICYINRHPGRGYHYSDTNACGESAASNKSKKKVITVKDLNLAAIFIWR